ncbi:MAG: hypothetical protein ABSC16_14800 [Candidatus Dormibacteria bacterium]
MPLPKATRLMEILVAQGYALLGGEYRRYVGDGYEPTGQSWSLRARGADEPWFEYTTDSLIAAAREMALRERHVEDADAEDILVITAVPEQAYLDANSGLAEATSGVLAASGPAAAQACHREPDPVSVLATAGALARLLDSAG